MSAPELDPAGLEAAANAACGTCDGSGVYREHVPGVEQRLESACPECGEALSRALDAFVRAYGRGITWAEVLPVVAGASGLEREYEKCARCGGRGDLFNGGWKRKPCTTCKSTGYGPLRGYALKEIDGG
jgi:DnaJ-class molecular chaperone